MVHGAWPVLLSLIYSGMDIFRPTEMSIYVAVRAVIKSIHGIMWGSKRLDRIFRQTR